MVDSRRLMTEKAALQNQLSMLQKNLTVLLESYNDLRIAKMIEANFLRRSNTYLAEQLKNKSLETDLLQAELQNSKKTSTVQEKIQEEEKSDDGNGWKFYNENQMPRITWHRLFDNLTRRFVEKMKPVEKMENLARATTKFLNQSLTSLGQFYDELQIDVAGGQARFFDSFWARKLFFPETATTKDTKCRPVETEKVTTAMIKLEVGSDQKSQPEYCPNEEPDFFAQLGRRLLDQLTPSRESLLEMNRLTSVILNESVQSFTKVFDSLHRSLDLNQVENATLDFLDSLVQTNQVADFWEEDEANDEQAKEAITVDEVVEFEEDGNDAQDLPADQPDLQSPAIDEEEMPGSSYPSEDDTGLLWQRKLRLEVKLVKNALKKSPRFFQLLDRQQSGGYLSTLKSFARFAEFDFDDYAWWQCQKSFWSGQPVEEDHICQDSLLEWQKEDGLLVDDLWASQDHFRRTMEAVLSGVKLSVENVKWKKQDWLENRWQARQFLRQEEELSQKRLQWVFMREKGRKSSRRWKSGGV